MHRQELNSPPTLLAGESQLLQLISEGAPLPQILDKVCTAIDVRLGDVVSWVLLPDDPERTLHTFEESAAMFGLIPFSCMAIVSTEGELLGTLETYCCFPRKSSPTEIKVIERAVQLAALVIQHYNHAMDTESYSLGWNDVAARGGLRERPPSSN